MGVVFDIDITLVRTEFAMLISNHSAMTVGVFEMRNIVTLGVLPGVMVTRFASLPLVLLLI